MFFFVLLEVNIKRDVPPAPVCVAWTFDRSERSSFGTSWLIQMSARSQPRERPQTRLDVYGFTAQFSLSTNLYRYRVRDAEGEVACRPSLFRICGDITYAARPPGVLSAIHFLAAINVSPILRWNPRIPPGPVHLTPDGFPQDEPVVRFRRGR